MRAHHVLRAAKAYAAAAEIGDVTASYRIFRDSKKLAALDAGKDLLTGRAAEAMQWMSDNWPAGKDWPAGIPRPRPSRKGEAA